MALDEAVLRRLDRREQELAELTPEVCLASASVLRDVEPRLTSDRQRELAEEMAQSFESQAAQSSESTSP